MLSSIQRMVIGTLAPHLSQSAVIPHLTAMVPVRLESGVMTPGLGSMIRDVVVSNSGSAVKLRSWTNDRDLRGGAAEKRCLTRETRPLDAAAIIDLIDWLIVTVEVGDLGV